MTTAKATEVLDFWFGEIQNGWSVEDRGKLWFLGDVATDAEIASRFRDMVTCAATGGLDDWAESPQGALALVIVLDQFTRNIYRGTAEAFSNDVQALATVEVALAREWDVALPFVCRTFLYMPLMHSEDLSRQTRCVDLFKRLVREVPASRRKTAEDSLKYAELHRDILERFGRFPHRNRLLGRESTSEETAWLVAEGESFGQ